MRDNQSDGDSDWQQPHQYVSPWSPPGESESAAAPWPRTGASPPGESESAAAPWPRTNASPPGEGGSGAAPWPRTGASPPGEGGSGAASWPRTGASPPPDNGGQDTIAFGGPAGPPGDRDERDYRYRSDGGHRGGYGDWRDYGGQGWHGDQRGYPGQRGSDDPGGHRDDGGYRAAGWDSPDPPGPSRHGGRFLVYLAVAALAASIGAGVTVAVDHHGPGASTSGISSSDVPGPGSNAAGSGSSSARLNRAAVEREVDPGLVDVVSTLKYSGETAEGTGMIISSSGLVLTNNHVIDQATSVQARLVDSGRDAALSYSVRIVGYDQTDDVALLQLVDASGLPTVSFGNSSQVGLGTPVLALGNAEGRGRATPAAGIINALNRSIHASDQGSDSTENLNHMLQTNAQIQQGDSGGALANSAGQVIGMITAANTASASQAGPPGGSLGFAIPSNNALAVASQIASGQASSTVYIGLPGFLGVEVAQSSSPDPQQQAAEEAGSGRPRSGSSPGCQVTNQQSGVPARIAPASSGALIVGVLCDTAASSQNLVPGDVITSVEGQPVTTPDSLTSITAMYHQGDVVSVSWVAIDGARRTASVALGAGPAR